MPPANSENTTEAGEPALNVIFATSVLALRDFAVALSIRSGALGRDLAAVDL